ncbi:pre-mRNA splicing factor clf1 [Sarocladium implicatum]|nr:pre-mRNA splicing factor clf1 [Sarocladium implicatum]
MSIPKPPSSLDNSCAVVHDKTLYTFYPEGFVSLPLKQGAKWKKLSMGEAVVGAKCVGTDTGLFVVGGTSGSDDYHGLQKYTYATREWSKITPTDDSVKNRQWHGVTYIKAVDRLVIYAGRQDGSRGPSSESFTIQASEPWQVRAFDAGAQKGLTDPIMLPWSDADAMMLGGDPLDTTVSLFNQDTSWRYWTTLADPIPRDTSTMNAVMVNGQDGSKSLLIFDMGASPNTVQRVVLQDASGAPVDKSAPVVSRRNDNKVTQKRDLTLDDWPEYNSTLASTASRTNYAMAQGDDGMVVFVGGNPDEPVAMFDTNENSWLNATSVLADSDDEQKIFAESSTTESSTRTTSTEVSSTEVSTTEATSSFVSSTAVETTTAAATSTEAVAADSSDSGSSSLDSNAILGITLGSIVGLLLLLGLILLCFRRRQLRQSHSEAGHARRASGMPISGDEKDSRGFANGAAPPTSPGHFRGHHPQNSQDSFSSMAILMGRMGNQKQTNTRKTSHDTARTSISSLHKQFKSTISKPIPHAEPTVIEDPEERNASPANTQPPVRPRNAPPTAQDGTRRSSGWNRYWSGGSALQILGFGGGKRNTGVSEQSSRYSESPHTNPRVTQDSATVPPLNFEGRASMHRVNSGSPVVSQYAPKLPIREGLSGKIERPVSRGSSAGYSSGIPESVNDAWDPTTGDRPWGADRAPSSAYVPSYYHATTFTPSQTASNQAHPPSGVSKQPQLAMASTSDMSWLNLGDQSRV